MLYDFFGVTMYFLPQSVSVFVLSVFMFCILILTVKRHEQKFCCLWNRRTKYASAFFKKWRLLLLSAYLQDLNTPAIHYVTCLFFFSFFFTILLTLFFIGVDCVHVILGRICCFNVIDTFCCVFIMLRIRSRK